MLGIRMGGALAVTALMSATASAPTASAEAGPGTTAGGIGWVHCAGAQATDPVRCGRVGVPVDRAHPGAAGRTDIQVARLPAADPAHRVGTLFFNPGGPGEGAVGYLSAQVRKTYFPPALREHFDIVAVEPRGTGTNEPLNCATPVDPSVTKFPGDGDEVRRLVASNRRLGAACLRAAGPVGSYLDTGSVARDLDSVRAALGERQVSFLGISYGTMLAQSYAEHFPGRVRAMVVDGVVDRSRSWRQLAEDDAIAVEDGVRRFGRWCRDDATCVLHDGSVRGTVAKVLRRADAGGVSDGKRRVRAEEVAQAVNAGLNEPQLYPAIARGLGRAAEEGSFDALKPFTNARNPNYSVYRPIICQDVPITAGAAAALPAEARRVAKLAPTLRGYSEFWDIATGCAGWPRAARWRPHPWRVPAGFPPPLLLSGAHDVATPGVWAQSVHRSLPGSTLLRWNGDGHAAWPTHAPSTVAAASRYLVDTR